MALLERVQFNNQGTETDSILEPPKALPDNCPISKVMSVPLHGQSDAYKLLAYQIAALDAGHEGQTSDGLALKAMKSDPGTDPTAVLTDIFTDFDIATNEYRCGAFLEGQYQATGQTREVARSTLISVYNRLAIINDRMKFYIEGRFSGPPNPDSNTDIKNAKTLTTLTDDRNAALSDLLSTTQMTALLSVYTGDKSASIIDTLDMSETERNQLLSQLD